MTQTAVSRRERHDLALATLESVVAPAAAALLSAVGPQRPALELELEHSTRASGAVERSFTTIEPSAI